MQGITSYPLLLTSPALASSSRPGRIARGAILRSHHADIALYRRFQGLGILGDVILMEHLRTSAICSTFLPLHIHGPVYRP